MDRGVFENLGFAIQMDAIMNFMNEMSQHSEIVHQKTCLPPSEFVNPLRGVF